MARATPKKVTRAVKKTSAKKVIKKTAPKKKATVKINKKQNTDYTHKVNPFHLAIPVHNLNAAKKFYGDVLGMTEGRTSTKW